MKVLHIISDLRRGGRERQLAIICSSGSGIENHIACFHKTKINYTDEYNSLNLIYLGNGKIKRISGITDYLKQNKIDLIHTWGNSETLYAFPASLISGIPLLNGSVRHGIRNNTFSHRLRSAVLKMSPYILGNSFTGYSANKIKINSKRHFVIYNGVEDKFFTVYDENGRKEFNIKHNLTESSIVFISVANFVPYKDYITPLKALAKLKSKGFSFHYIIIGKGPLLEDIKKIINELGLEKYISIFNDNPDIPSLLSISDIMIHSSLGEGCSNAILEASAAGLIVVASDTGGTKEIKNKYTMLFGYMNENDLLAKIEDAVKLHRSGKETRTEIRDITRERFSVKSMISNYENAVKSILYNSSRSKQI